MQIYNISDKFGSVHRVRVLKSIQYNYWERHLTVSAKQKKKLEQLGPCYAEAPTPYRPKVIFHS
jgi:hypothetical protein